MPVTRTGVLRRSEPLWTPIPSHYSFRRRLVDANAEWPADRAISGTSGRTAVSLRGKPNDRAFGRRRVSTMRDITIFIGEIINLGDPLPVATASARTPRSSLPPSPALCRRTAATSPGGRQPPARPGRRRVRLRPRSEPSSHPTAGLRAIGGATTSEGSYSWWLRIPVAETEVATRAAAP